MLTKLTIYLALSAALLATMQSTDGRTSTKRREMKDAAGAMKLCAEHKPTCSITIYSR